MHDLMRRLNSSRLTVSWGIQGREALLEEDAPEEDAAESEQFFLM